MSCGTSTISAPLSELTLDPSLYNPTAEEVAFFKSQTKIDSDEELKQHVFAVQKEAWDVVHYLCIRIFAFLKLGISSHPKYPMLLNLAKERPGAIFLEVACFTGTDVRKTIADGYPLENIVATDIEPAFWGIGHKLFKTTPETFPVPFVGGNVLDPKFIEPRSPFYEPPTTSRPGLEGLTSLTPLQGHVSAIHAAAFFHLFDEETQLQAARALASLLSPEPGSMIFGYHMSRPATGEHITVSACGFSVYYHSPESWRALWDGVVFDSGNVEVWAELKEIDNKDIGRAAADAKMHIMIWSIRRL